MTGIVIDTYDNQIFVFADGRVTSDDVIVTETDRKIIKTEPNVMYTSCGDAHLLTMYLNGEVPHGEGMVIEVLPDRVNIIDFINSEKPVFTKYELTALPLFFGSGSIALKAAYQYGDVSKSNKECSYLHKIERIFESASKTINSMGLLYQSEKIDRL